MRERAWFRWSVAALTAASLALSCAWALAMPYFDGPDEFKHYDAVSRLVQGLGWPDPYEADVLGTTWLAVSQAQEGTHPEARALLASPSAFTDGGVNQMVQHPPAYYLVAAGVVAAFGGEDLRWDVALTIMRMTTAVLQALSIPLLAWTVARLASRQTAIVGASVLAAIPFLSTVGGYVSNDALVILTSTATCALAVRIATDERLRWWIPVLGGLAYGAALLSKGYALMLAPTLVALVVIGIVRHRPVTIGSVALRAVVPAVIAFAVGGWWWVRNLVVLGTLQPSVLGDRERLDEPFEGYDLHAFLQGFVMRLSGTFWGRGGREEVAYDATLTTVASIVLLATLVFGLVVARRRLELLALAIVPVIIAATLLHTAHSIYWDSGDPNRGVQGRYLYSGILVVVAAAIAAILARLRPRFGRTWRPTLVVLTLAPCVIAQVALHWSADRIIALHGTEATAAADLVAWAGWHVALVPVCAAALGGVVAAAALAAASADDQAERRSPSASASGRTGLGPTDGSALGRISP